MGPSLHHFTLLQWIACQHTCHLSNMKTVGNVFLVLPWSISSLCVTKSCIDVLFHISSLEATLASLYCLILKSLLRFFVNKRTISVAPIPFLLSLLALNYICIWSKRQTFGLKWKTEVSKWVLEILSQTHYFVKSPSLTCKLNGVLWLESIIVRLMVNFQSSRHK